MFRISIVRLGRVLVIDLPADYIGIVAETLGHLGRHLHGQLTVLLICPVELLAIAVLILAAIFLCSQGLRVLRREPRRWSGAWRTEHDVDMVLLCSTNSALDPIQLIVALTRFHGAPCELCDANEADTCLLHQRQVSIPSALGPLLGIPCRTQEE